MYSARRQQVMQSLAEQDLLLVPSNTNVIRNNDVCYQFHQDSSFSYLTGWSAPDAILALTKTEARFFCKKLTDHSVLWEGASLGLEQAQNLLDMPCADIETFVAMPGKNYLSTAPANPLLKNISCKDFSLGSLRVIKSAYELEQIQQAINYSIKGHLALMSGMQHSVTERALYGTWMQSLYDFDLQHEAYPAIIAAGKNACVLHYHELSGKCQSGELLLVDAGMEVNGYAADLTRTLPVSGKFSELQARIYQHVLDIQLSVADFCQPGVSLLELNKYADTLYLKALDDLSVKGPLRKYAPHSIGHSLGLDVHDVGLVRDLAIPEAAVITIEPGLYFPDTKYAGIGVRIEDNYLMTSKGLVCLSSALPKSITEVEYLCG